MNKLQILVLGLLILLCLSSGVAKLMLIPNELAYFTGIGLSVDQLKILGRAHFVSGLMLLIPKIRKAGAILASFAFAVSVIVIYINGQTSFAIFSLFPIVISYYIFISVNKSQSIK